MFLSNTNKDGTNRLNRGWTGFFFICFLLLMGGCEEKSEPPSFLNVIFRLNYPDAQPDPFLTVQVTAGQPASAPTEPKRDGFEFDGWYSDSQGQNLFDFSTLITSNRVLYAGWRGVGIFNVTFYTKEGQNYLGVQAVDAGTLAEKPKDPARPGYAFLGWYKDPETKEPFNFNSDPIVEDINLYAKWEPIIAISFQLNGGNGTIEPQGVEKGGKATPPASSPTRDGYRFDAWYADSALSHPFDFDTPITSSIVVYAKWIRQFTATFEAGGAFTIPPMVVDSGMTIVPPNPSRTNGRLYGWYGDNGFSIPFDFDGAMVSDTTLYGKEVDKTLKGILFAARIPTDLSSYPKLAQEALASYPPAAQVRGRYITESGAGNQSGSSWANAASDPSAILENITDADRDKVYIVFIAGGLYNTRATIAMKNHVAIIGGWEKTGGWTRPEGAITQLSGNGQHSVIRSGNGVDGNALLYGVTVTGGRASRGAGMHNSRSAPRLYSVTFDSNEAMDGEGLGGGMYNAAASPLLYNVVFKGNQASQGGGMYNTSGAFPKLYYATFDANKATRLGGGMFNTLGGSPTVYQSLFIDNEAQSGGGVYNKGGVTNTLTFASVNVTFARNKAALQGGAVCNEEGALCYIIGNTFWQNTAKEGSGIYLDNDNGHAPRIVNTIFWDNAKDEEGEIFLFNDVPKKESIHIYHSILKHGIGKTKDGALPESGKSVEGLEGKGLKATSGTGEVTVYYDKVSDKDPSLNDVADNGGLVQTVALGGGSAAIRSGVYVRQANGVYYTSADGAVWHKGLSAKGAVVDIPSEAEDLTALDARGYRRSAKPDIGAYQEGGMPPK